MPRDLISSMKVLAKLDPAVRTADANVADIDLAGYDSALIVVAMGAEGITIDADNYIQVKLEHGDLTSSYAAVAATDIIGITPEVAGMIAMFNAVAEAPASSIVQYIGGKRYLKVTVDHVGTHGTGTPYGIVVIGLNARQQPTA